MTKGFVHLGSHLFELLGICRVHGIHIRLDAVHQLGIHGVDAKTGGIGCIVLLENVGCLGGVGSRWQSVISYYILGQVVMGFGRSLSKFA